MTILLKKTRGLLATILCIILLAANVLLVSADSEGDSGGAQQLEAGYIFESPTEEGKDIFIQLGEEGDELSEAVLETEELSQKQIVSGEVIGNVAASSAVIAGAVKGDIDVKGPVILDASAIVMGNIKSKSVQINNGAVIEGMCSQCYAEVNPTDFFNDLIAK